MHKKKGENFGALVLKTHAQSIPAADFDSFGISANKFFCGKLETFRDHVPEQIDATV
jgi:hypothetical protein